MKPNILAFVATILIALTLLPTNIHTYAQSTRDKDAGLKYQINQPEFENTRLTFTEEDYEKRIAEISGDVELRYNKYVRGNIDAYLRYPRLTERLIGKSTIYFPIFEEYLEKYDLPEELKFLPVIESALDPTAVSRVGAGGLWQFMPYTGNEYNLRINEYVDERMDPRMSTEAAMKFLTNLHERYDDWILALAAYNCGPGRVNKAIRRTGSKDFWKIYKHLPKETRNYVPAYIAVAYLMNYYQIHGLNPVYPSLDYQVTDTMIVHQHLDFSRIVKKCDVELEVVQKLNPSFKLNFIPTNHKGYVLTLPAGKMALFRGIDPMDAKYLAANEQPPGEKVYMKDLEDPGHTIYEIQNGETLWDVARHYPGVSVRDIIRVNQLADIGKIKPGAHLKIPEG
ncbi:MAG: transglycosylase SLT domain-containing protein [Bacteroidota bacterium]